MNRVVYTYMLAWKNVRRSTTEKLIVSIPCHWCAMGLDKIKFVVDDLVMVVENTRIGRLTLSLLRICHITRRAVSGSLDVSSVCTLCKPSYEHEEANPYRSLPTYTANLSVYPSPAFLIVLVCQANCPASPSLCIQDLPFELLQGPQFRVEE